MDSVLGFVIWLLVSSASWPRSLPLPLATRPASYIPHPPPQFKSICQYIYATLTLDSTLIRIKWCSFCCTQFLGLGRCSIPRPTLKEIMVSYMLCSKNIVFLNLKILKLDRIKEEDIGETVNILKNSCIY